MHTLRYKFAAWSCLIGHPLYYLFWSRTDYEDSFSLRFGTALMCSLLLLVDHWPVFLKKHFDAIWHITLMFALPVIFTYTLLANNYSGLWLATHVGMLTLLMAAVQYTKVFFLLLITGTIIGIIWYQQAIGGDALTNFPTEYLPVFFFVTIIGLMFLHLSIQNIIDTERRLQVEQEKVEQERRRSHHLKSLAGSIAHEMRNPLSQIYGIFYMIERELPNNNEYVKIVPQVIKNGFQLIDLTMDAIQEKPINKDNFKIISAQNLVTEAISEYAYTEIDHKNKISAKGSDFSFLADPVLVKYVLYNLISNALYYVKSIPDSKIIISLLPDTRQIEVRDTAKGIAPEEIPKLFDNFYTSDKLGGTGLGLAYCKRTMKALGGDIYCTSELGKHTCFFLSFPQLNKHMSIIKT